MKLLGEYSSKLNQAARLLLARESDSTINTLCACGAGNKRTVRCLECDVHSVVCPTCWIRRHRYNATHWAYVWQESGYFVKHDISALGYTIPLGHGGDECPSAAGPVFLIIADINGIHATRVKHCNCETGQQLDKWTKLFMSDFFPSTVVDPQSVFTFRLLRQFSILTLQSKITPYDYMKSIRRLTDNVFTGNVPASTSFNV